MFGGLAFLLGGNLAVAVSGQGGIMVRVDPAEEGELLASSRAEEVVMRGRPMTGWLRVAPELLSSDQVLSEWVARAVARVHAVALGPEPGPGLTPGGRPAG